MIAPQEVQNPQGCPAYPASGKLFSNYAVMRVNATVERFRILLSTKETSKASLVRLAQTITRQTRRPARPERRPVSSVHTAVYIPSQPVSHLPAKNSFPRALEALFAVAQGAPGKAFSKRLGSRYPGLRTWQTPTYPANLGAGLSSPCLASPHAPASVAVQTTLFSRLRRSQ